MRHEHPKRAGFGDAVMSEPGNLMMSARLANVATSATVEVRRLIAATPSPRIEP